GLRRSDYGRAGEVRGKGQLLQPRHGRVRPGQRLGPHYHSRAGRLPSLTYLGGSQRWIGDNHFIFLKCGKIRGLGWRPRKTIADSIRKTVRYIRENRWLLEPR